MSGPDHEMPEDFSGIDWEQRMADEANAADDYNDDMATRDEE